MDVDSLVKKLIKHHGTNNPFEIARDKNIMIIREWLGSNTWGYFSNVNRIPMIHVCETAEGFVADFTVAHELGHSIMHPKLSTPFLKKNTFFSVDRIEREANRFATLLLVGDNTPEIGETKSQFLLRCGIPNYLHTFY